MKFRKKPVVIDAFQMTVGDLKMVGYGVRGIDWPEWLVSAFIKNANERGSIFADRKKPGLCIKVSTLEGDHIVSPNDWIIRGYDTESISCTEDELVKYYRDA